MKSYLFLFFLFVVVNSEAQSFYWNGPTSVVNRETGVIEDRLVSLDYFKSDGQLFLMNSYYHYNALDSIGLQEVDQYANELDFHLIIEANNVGPTIFSQIEEGLLIFEYIEIDRWADYTDSLYKNFNVIIYDMSSMSILYHLKYQLKNAPNNIGKAGRSVRRGESLFTVFPNTPDTLRYVEVTNVLTNPELHYYEIPRENEDQQNLGILASLELHGNGEDFIYWSTTNYGILSGKNLALPASSQVSNERGNYGIGIGEMHWVKDNNTIVQFEGIQDWPIGGDIQGGLLFKQFDDELNLLAIDTFFEEQREQFFGVLSAASNAILEDESYLYFLATDAPSFRNFGSFTYVFKYTKDLVHVNTTKYAMPDNFYILGSKLIEDKGLMIWGNNNMADYWDRRSAFCYLIDSVGIITSNKEAPVQMEYSISSNPGRDYFSITIGNEDLVGMNLVVNSNMGQVMYTSSLEYGENVINTSSWAVGAYYYTLIDKQTGRKQTGKWIKV